MCVSLDRTGSLLTFQLHFPMPHQTRFFFKITAQVFPEKQRSTSSPSPWASRKPRASKRMPGAARFPPKTEPFWIASAIGFVVGKRGLYKIGYMVKKTPGEFRPQPGMAPEKGVPPWKFGDEPNLEF